VQVAEDRLNVNDLLTVKRNAEPEHSMRAGVLRPQVYGDWLGP
jgi:hypothetical protein